MTGMTYYCEECGAACWVAVSIEGTAVFCPAGHQMTAGPEVR